VSAVAFSADVINRVEKFAGALESLIRQYYPEAIFEGPYFWEEMGLWLLDTYSLADDFDLRSLVSDLELELLLNEDIGLLVIPLPLTFYRPATQAA
jgi:hypothetical protein